MNAGNGTRPARLGRETRLGLRPLTAATFRASEDTALERLKSRLLREHLASATDPELYAPLRRAANEAAALAWTTSAPLLVFPGLFQEKAQAAFVQAARQELIWERSRELLAA